MRTNDYQKALTILQKVESMDPNEVQPHMMLATTYRHLGNKEGEKAELEVFQKLSKANMERRQPYDSILKGGGEQKEPLHATEEEDPDTP